VSTSFCKIVRATAQQAQQWVQQHTRLSKQVAMAMIVTYFSGLAFAQDPSSRSFLDPVQLEAQAKFIVSQAKIVGYTSKDVNLSITAGKSLFYPLQFLTANNTLQTGFVRNQSHAELTTQGCRVTLNHTQLETIFNTLQEMAPTWSAASIVELVARHELAHCEDQNLGLNVNDLATNTVTTVASLMKWDATEQALRVTALETRLKEEPWLRTRMQEQYADVSTWILNAKNWDDSASGVSHPLGTHIWQDWRHQNNVVTPAHDTSHSLALLRKVPQSTLAQLSVEETKNAAQILSGLAILVPDFQTLDAIDIQPAFKPAAARFNQAKPAHASSVTINR
jgi:hypothetical protein